MNDQNNHPCRCGHFLEAHFEDIAQYGGWEYLDDVGEEVWREESYPRPMCGKCEDDCLYEQMTNLEYLEWKYEEHKR